MLGDVGRGGVYPDLSQLRDQFRRRPPDDAPCASAGIG